MTKSRRRRGPCWTRVRQPSANRDAPIDRGTWRAAPICREDCGPPDRPDLFAIGAALILVATATTARANENLPFPGAVPGPPVYATFSPFVEEIPRDGNWAAVAFYRDPACVPPNYNFFD